MPIKEAEDFLPEKNNGPVDAFTRVSIWHSGLGKTVDDMFRLHPDKKVGQAVSDYFTASVAYLSNRSDDQAIQNVGRETWLMVANRRTNVLMTTNMAVAAMALGVPAEQASRFITRNTEPHVLFMANKQKNVIEELAYVLMPPEFILKANASPCEALAAMTFISSQVRDLAHGRLTIDPQHLVSRAYALEAQFLLNVLEKEKKIEMGEISKDVLKKYPKGIASLPKGVWYNSRPTIPSKNS